MQQRTSEYTFSGLVEPYDDYEVVRQEIISKMIEMYEGWKERQLNNTANEPIEIDPELKLSLN